MQLEWRTSFPRALWNMEPAWLGSRTLAVILQLLRFLLHLVSLTMLRQLCEAKPSSLLSPPPHNPRSVPGTRGLPCVPAEDHLPHLEGVWVEAKLTFTRSRK